LYRETLHTDNCVANFQNTYLINKIMLIGDNDHNSMKETYFLSIQHESAKTGHSYKTETKELLFEIFFVVNLMCDTLSLYARFFRILL
jgi:hypothetical protein